MQDFDELTEQIIGAAKRVSLCPRPSSVAKRKKKTRNPRDVNQGDISNGLELGSFLSGTDTFVHAPLAVGIRPG